MRPWQKTLDIKLLYKRFFIIHIICIYLLLKVKYLIDQDLKSWFFDRLIFDTLTLRHRWHHTLLLISHTKLRKKNPPGCSIKKYIFATYNRQIIFNKSTQTTSHIEMYSFLHRDKSINGLQRIGQFDRNSNMNKWILASKLGRLNNHRWGCPSK